MVHIHIPDGVLPVWIWAAGYVVTLALVALTIRRIRQQERKGILAAVMVAVMLVVQSIPIGIPYHMNLSALTGIIVGPSWALVSILVVNFVQASFGHGGITIAGLNTLVVWSEALAGYGLFVILRKTMRTGRVRGPLAAGFSTFVALALSAFLVVGIVAISGIDPAQALGEHFPEFLSSAAPLQVSLRVFMMLTLPIALGGAILEAAVTALLLAYVFRVKPSLIPGVA